MQNEQSRDDKKQIVDEKISRRPVRTYWEIVRKQFFKNKMAVVGAAIVFLMFFVAIFAPFLANDKPFVLHKKHTQSYFTTWKALSSLVNDVNRAVSQVEKKEERVQKISEFVKEYKKIKSEQITVDGVSKELAAGTDLKALKKKIYEERAEPFQIGPGEKKKLYDAGASDEFIKWLKDMETKFDKISLEEIIKELKKGKSLKKIKGEIEEKRVNPFYLSFDQEDLIIDAFRQRLKDESEAYNRSQGFLNYLSQYGANLDEELKKARSTSRKDFIASLNMNTEKKRANFQELVEKLKGLMAKDNPPSLEGLSAQYASLMDSFKNKELPESQDLKKLKERVKELGPSWLEEFQGGVQIEELSSQTRYPLFAQLRPSEIFFMVLFLMFFLAPLPLALVNLFHMDSFYQFFAKIAAVLFIPFLCAFLWYQMVPYQEDRSDYREIVKNLQPGDYAYIQPFFFGITDQMPDRKFQPPSWTVKTEVGIRIKKEEDRMGQLVFEEFKVEKSGDSGQPNIESSHLKNLKEKLQLLKDGDKKSLSVFGFGTLRKGTEDFQQFEKKINNYQVKTSFEEYNLRGDDVLIPKDRLVFVSPKTKRLNIRGNIILSPGATLVLPSNVSLNFNFTPPSLNWLSTSCEKLPTYHLFGTDYGGRDIFTRMIWGARISLSVGFVAVGIYVLIGIILGSLAGYFGGWVDIVISRFIEVMICFPSLVLIITVIAVVPPWIAQIWSGMFAIMVVIGITRWTGVARLIRGEFLRIRNQDFVTAGKALGVSNTRLIFRHIVPNALAPVLVSATFGVAAAILIESSLSFLGLGVRPPTPTWGDMLAQARGKSLQLWWLTVFPGIAIFVTVTAYNLVGEGVRDAIDPRLKER